MNDVGRKIDIGGIFTAALNDIGGNIGRYGGLAIALSIVGGLADTYDPRLGNFVANLMAFFMSVLAVYYTLQNKLGDDAIRPRFGAAFGYNLLSNLAIGFGLLLLIVPGLILYTRWAVGLPALLREDLSVSEAMGRSSSLTEGNRWRILGLGLLIWVPFLLVMMMAGGLSAAFAGEQILDTLPFNMLTNLAAGCATLFASVCWTEAYLSLSGEEESSNNLAEIFA
jgi:uncharacterized membrane protein